LLAAEALGTAPTAQRYAAVSATVMRFMTSTLEVTRTLIVAELSRASKRYTCSKCRAEIRRGELYVLWRLRGFGSAYTEKYCLSCGAKEAKLMLKHSTKRLLIYANQGEDYATTPVKDAPLPEEWRRKVEELLSVGMAKDRS
jgi:RNase P subunit RPR2